MAPTRWGICATGLISRGFGEVFQYLPKDDHKLVAVGSRELEKSKQFAAEFNVEKAYGSYREVADDDDVEVVYIGTIHQVHYELCKMMMDKGKHVLVEKPMTMNARLAQELVDYARQKNVFFMEAFWSRLFPIYNKIREELASGSLGDVVKVEANFNFNLPDLGWRGELQHGGGVLLLIGVYPVQLATMVYNEDPVRVQAMAKINDGGVDVVDCVQLEFSGGRFAQFYCSWGDGPTNARIIGTKGIIDIPELFFCPTRATMPSGTYHIPNPGPEFFAGLGYEVKAVRKCLLQGLKECPEMPLSESLRIARICDEIRHQIGLVYAEDK